MADRLIRAKASYLLLVLFVGMVLTGLAWGGFGKVMANGIVICLDCIGLI
ncbi:MAG: hypothetical protein V1748_01320 [Actinomycetota bacterium]